MIAEWPGPQSKDIDCEEGVGTYHQRSPLAGDARRLHPPLRHRRITPAPRRLRPLLVVLLRVELQDPSSHPLFLGGVDQPFVQQLLQHLKLAQAALWHGFR